MKHCLLRKTSITTYIIVNKMEMFCFLDVSPGDGTFFVHRGGGYWKSNENLGGMMGGFPIGVKEACG